MKHKVQWVQCSGSGGNAQVPLLGSAALSDTTLWIVHSSLVEGCRNESGGVSGIFDVL